MQPARSGLHQAIGGLTNGRRLAVRVTATGAAGGSTTVSGTPSAGYPLAITRVTARPGSGNSVVVHATGGGRATRIGVIAGGDATNGVHHFRTKWYPATQHPSKGIWCPTQHSDLAQRLARAGYAEAFPGIRRPQAGQVRPACAAADTSSVSHDCRPICTPSPSVRRTPSAERRSGRGLWCTGACRPASRALVLPERRGAD